LNRESHILDNKLEFAAVLIQVGMILPCYLLGTS